MNEAPFSSPASLATVQAKAVAAALLVGIQPARMMGEMLTAEVLGDE